jgi:hypothetical protein
LEVTEIPEYLLKVIKVSNSNCLWRIFIWECLKVFNDCLDRDFVREYENIMVPLPFRFVKLLNDFSFKLFLSLLSSSLNSLKLDLYFLPFHELFLNYFFCYLFYLFNQILSDYFFFRINSSFSYDFINLCLILRHYQVIGISKSDKRVVQC